MVEGIIATLAKRDDAKTRLGNPGQEDPLKEMLEIETEICTFTVPESLHSKRLDMALTALLPAFSRSYLQQCIERNLVQVDGKAVAKAAARLKLGQSLQVGLFETAQSQSFRPESIHFPVVYEDDAVLVVDKPVGLVVRPAPGNWSGTLLNGLLHYHANALLLPRAGIVHRLDKDTSGVMVVAKTRSAMDALVQQLANRTVSRTYLAIGATRWKCGQPEHTVQSAIGRDANNRLKMAVVDMRAQSGKPAVTHLQCLDTTDAACLVRCTLETGRTHQIRVHLSSLGMPLAGDVTYGGTPNAYRAGQALHATHLAFNHPVTDKPVAFECSLPADLRNLAVSLGLNADKS